MKKVYSFLLVIVSMLALRMSALADALIPPEFVDQKPAPNPWLIAVLVAAVVVIAIVILIRVLSKRKK